VPELVGRRSAQHLHRRRRDELGRATISALHAAWGNPEFIATVSYLEAAAARAVELKGAVLECGSGLSTLLLGTLAESNGFSVWTLEHDREWYETVAAFLQRHRVRNVHLCYAPLRDYGDGISWYDVHAVELPEVFSLVVCDGPPNWKTPGGRYGVVVAMRERFSKEWNILLDDPIAAEKTGMLARLNSEPGVQAVRHTFDDGAFFWVTRSDTQSIPS
jgi:hypothetical protein